MKNNNISIQERTENFAIRIINAYSKLNEDKPFNNAIAVLSKQFLRSGTSIGANCSEAKYSSSRKEFLSKYLIALREANETRYWINLFIKTDKTLEKRFLPMLQELTEIINILIATTKKLKE